MERAGSSGFPAPELLRAPDSAGLCWRGRLPHFQDRCIGSTTQGLRNLPLATLDRVADYTPGMVAALLRGGAIQLIDVRQREEYEAGRIAGARLIELAQLSAQAQAIDPDRPVVFYCRSGSRSVMAAEAFTRAGFEAHNLAGGLLDWQAAGLPIEPDGGYVAA
jgi:rhodanese-related sulfurtransferase